jgi:hypothetical protein
MRNGEGSRRGLRAFWLACALVVAAPLVHAQAAVSPEEVKAAFLFRFAGFVDWPAQAKTDEGFVFGLVAAPEVETQLRRYASLRPVGQQHAQVRRLESPADLDGVHVLYIGSRDAARLARWADAARHRAVLVVTDAPDGLERGGMLNFITTDRVQFEASVEAASRAGLRLDARLLSVAVRVKKGDASEPTLYAGRTRALTHRSSARRSSRSA